MGLLKVAELALDDLVRHAVHRFGDVGKKPRLLPLVEKVKQGPRGPALRAFWLPVMGAPAEVVNCFFSSMICSFLAGSVQG